MGLRDWYQIADNCPYRKTLTKWLTAFPSSSNQIGCDYFPSTRVQSNLPTLPWCWHMAPTPSQPFIDLLSQCPEWGLRSPALDFIVVRLGLFWPLSTLHTQLKCLGKVSKDPMCGPSTHQTTPLLLQRHMPAEVATRAFLPELSPLELATDMRVMWETWRARREPTTCSITGDINQGRAQWIKAPFSAIFSIPLSNLLVSCYYKLRVFICISRFSSPHSHRSNIKALAEQIIEDKYYFVSTHYITSNI